MVAFAWVIRCRSKVTGPGLERQVESKGFVYLFHEVCWHPSNAGPHPLNGN